VALAVDLALGERYNLAVPSGQAAKRRCALVVGVGIDLVDLDEFRAGLTDDVVEELFLPAERAYALTQVRSWENLGARVAAKMAVFAALRAEGEPAWLEVEVVRGESGELDVRMSGNTLARARELRVRTCSLSMTHTRSTALAIAVLED
jgi:holo-[acyl-carrier protein] synthase